MNEYFTWKKHTHAITNRNIYEIYDNQKTAENSSYILYNENMTMRDLISKRF